MFVWFSCLHLIQIIHKIKLQTSSDVVLTPSEICDRIFELVDENNDGEFDTKTAEQIYLYLIDIKVAFGRKNLIKSKCINKAGGRAQFRGEFHMFPFIQTSSSASV